MKLYRVTWHDRDNGRLYAWIGTQREAHATLREIWDNYEGERADALNDPPVIEPVEIPTDKAGLLSWLNNNFTSDNG